MKVKSNRQSRRCRPVSARWILVIIFTLLISVVAAETNVEWTPNEEEGSGPLPLSQNQRQQLLQLEQSIMSSPDPSATLHQVAEANNMDPRELADMLDRNRKDMGGAAATGGGGGTLSQTWPRTIIKLMASLVAVVLRSAKSNPRSFGFMATTLLLLMYVLFSAPRTGIVLSTRRSILSKGPTTIWNPPGQYVDKLLDSSQLSRSSLSAPLKKGLDLDVQHGSKDGVEWHKPGRKSDMIQAVTAQTTIDVDSLIPDGEDNDADEQDEGTVSKQEEMSELVYDAAAAVLSSRRLSEFVDPPKSVRMQSSNGARQRHAYLVIKKLGDWGRYGLQPLKVSNQQESQDESRLVFSTIRGGHFDGEIAISVQRSRNNNIVVRTSLAVPKKGKKLNKKLAALLVSSLSSSVTRSTMTQAKQILARQSQSSRYRGHAKDRATEKRHTRFENERKHEEMARDRKRKWQRRNPDSGRYRPSGTRMQSPNNC